MREGDSDTPRLLTASGDGHGSTHAGQPHFTLLPPSSVGSPLPCPCPSKLHWDV